MRHEAVPQCDQKKNLCNCKKPSKLPLKVTMLCNLSCSSVL